MKKILFLLSLVFFCLIGWAQPIVKVGCSEYRAFFLTADGKVRASLWDNAQTASVATLYPLPPIMEIEGGQYIAVVLDSAGKAYTLANNSPTFTSWPTDASGQQFIENVHIYAYMNTQYTLKADGSIWGWGASNPYKFAAWSAKPVKINSGIPFIKLVTGSVLVGLTTTGDVYDFIGGQPVKRTTGASDIFSSYSDFRGAVIGGRVYAWGGAWAIAFFNLPVLNSIPAIMPWGRDVVKIVSSWNTLKYIDKSGDLYSMGNNAMGEVGIGTEWVNKAEVVPNQYVWDWDNVTKFPAQKMIYTPAKIASGVTDIFTGNSYVFYTYALIKGGVYSWGKNKSVVLGNGKAINQESTIPNALDVTAPTLVTPLTAKGRGIDFKVNTLTAGPDQAVVGRTATLTGSGVPSTGYVITAYKWTQITGLPATIVSPDRAITQVTGLKSGACVFRLQMIDNNGATISDDVVLSVTVPQPKAIIYVDSSIIHYPNTVFNLIDTSTNSLPGVWTVKAGPNKGIFTGIPGTRQIVFSGVIPGQYTLGLAVSDNSGATDSAQITLTVVGPAACPICPVCPPLRTVNGVQAIINGQTFPIPLAWLTFTYTDGNP